jgi:hypothetical protein
MDEAKTWYPLWDQGRIVGHVDLFAAKMWTKSSKRNNNATASAHEQWEKLRQCQTHAHFPDSTEKGHKQVGGGLTVRWHYILVQHAVENRMDSTCQLRPPRRAGSKPKPQAGARGKRKTLTKAKSGQTRHVQRRVEDSRHGVRQEPVPSSRGRGRGCQPMRMRSVSSPN